MSIEKSLAKYPRINHAPTRLKPTSQALCWICGKRAEFKVEIEVNWFRGDDEVVRACAEHKSCVSKNA